MTSGDDAQLANVDLQLLFDTTAIIDKIGG